MPIPARLRPPTPTVEEFREYIALCNRIENARSDEVSILIERWNTRAGRVYSPSDFQYHGATDTDTFVGEMLLGPPAFVSDLAYAELREVLTTVVTVQVSEAVLNHFIGWLEVNLPDSNITNLIYWPNYWFNNESLLHVEFTPDQMLAYAMAKCGRQFSDAPTDVPMPYPIPAKS